MSETGKLVAAVASLPASADEADLLNALVRSACLDLGWSTAWVRRVDPPEVVCRWPAGTELTPSRDCCLFGGLVLEVAGHGDPEALQGLSVFCSRLLEEGRARARLAQRVERQSRRFREAEDRHRNLTLRLAELRGELDTTQQQHLVLSERNRIAQDLRDRAAQTNFLLALKLDWALAHLAPDDPLHAELERMKELAAQSAAQTREAIYALRASELAEDGLPGGLRRLVHAMEAEGFTANLTVSGVPALLPSDVEDALFKVCQEALNNTRNHSRGSVVIVALRFTPAAVTLVVQDNGVGLPEGAPAEWPGHLGLKGMRQRVLHLGGELRLLRGDEGGLIVRATIPLKGDHESGDSHPHRG